MRQGVGGNERWQREGVGSMDRLDGTAVAAWARAATTALAAVRGPIDSLNIFPVADSDTGTNLYLTLAAGAHEVATGTSGATARGALEMLADGALLGARGNSGVIASQFLLGLARVGAAPDGSLDAAGLARALDEAQRAARAAVARPVEGTILTAATAAARAARIAADAGGGLAATASAALAGAREALARTTDELAVLRAAGVVDAGAAGLVVILETLVAVITGQPAGFVPVLPRTPATSPAATSAMAVGAMAGSGPVPDGEFEVMYVVETASPAGGPELSLRLQELGESVAVVGGPVVWHAHVHTDDPAAAVAAGSTGRQRQIVVRHLDLEVAPAATSLARLGLVVGTRAPALARELARTGAVVMVLTDDPTPRESAAHVLRAVVDAGASHVAVLPGSSAVRTAALEVAGRLAAGGGVPGGSGSPPVGVHVVAALDDIHAVTGLAAAVAARTGTDADAQLAAIAGAVARVRTAEISLSDVEDARRVADELLAGGGDVLTMLRGAHGDGRALAELLEHLADAHPRLEVVVLDGGQATPAIALALE